MRADAYATAFMVLGYERTLQFLSDHAGLDVYLIYNDINGEYRTWYTGGMEKVLIESR
jgi:thiamine biosynthesis lipoprotein